MRTAFITVVAAQLLFLAVEAGRYSVIIPNAPTVVLRVIPIDPRSVFLGNYARLNYDVSQLSFKKLSPDSARVSDLENGRIVWVEFEPGPEGAAARSIRLHPPSAEVPGRIYLRARIDYIDDMETVRIDYGLERYYIPEEREKEVNDLFTMMNKDPAKTRVTAEIAVLDSGQGVVKRLLVNGKPLPF